MLLIHSLPTRAATYSVTSGSLHSDIAALNDPSPGERVAISTPESGTVTIETQLPEQIQLGAAALRGVRLLAGEPMLWQVRLQAYTSGQWRDLMTRSLAALPGGDIGATFDVSASAIVASQFRVLIQTPVLQQKRIEVGSFIVGAGSRRIINSGWSIDQRQRSTIDRTLGGQLNIVHYPGYRILRMKPALAELESAYQGPDSWQYISAELCRDPVVLAIARADVDGHANTQTTSIYGVVTSLPSVTHAAGPWHTISDLVVEELPGS